MGVELLPNYLTPKLEFSTDPLSVSNAAAVWKDVTRYCITMDWQSGTTREFDDPQAGQATFVLKNSQRRFEPEYAAGAYYPNIVPGRRFRLTLTADGFSYQQGIWYAQSWQVEYPAGTTYSTVTVTCSDGFWRLALKRLGNLSPSTAESYQDVVKFDNPMAYYPLNELSGRTTKAEVGDDGTYLGYVDHVLGNPVIGSSEPTANFNGVYGKSYAKLPLADEGVFFDVNRFTVEAVAIDATFGAGSHLLAAGPWNTADAAPVFNLTPRSATAQVNIGASTVSIGAVVGSDPSPGRHHFAATWDGVTLSYYIDGVLQATASQSGNIDTGVVGESLYIGGNGHSQLAYDGKISHVAFYLDTLTPSRIKAHADAAVTLGRPAELSGTRLSSVISDSLWSTAGLAAGAITCAPITYIGQLASEAVSEANKVEQPGSVLVFDDQGNPDFQSIMDTQQVVATFGDTTSEIQYDGITLTYNDEIFNSSSVGGEGLQGTTVDDAASISDYGARAQDATDLQIIKESDAALLARAIVDRFATPAFRIDSITLNAADADARAQILAREVGDTIRIKRRGEGGTAIDIITRILQKEKHLSTDAHLTCTWTLARGFSAVSNVNHLGVSGYNQLDVSFILS